MPRVFAGITALLAAAACFVSVDDVPDYRPPPPEAGVPVEAGRDATPSYQPPPPPAADDPSNDRNQSFVVALHTLDLGEGKDPIPYGYDLDRQYTCFGDGGGAESCTLATGIDPHCDGDGGIDNSGGKILVSFAQQSSEAFSEAKLNDRLQRGKFTVLILVSGYNGQPNDTDVTVGILASPGFFGSSVDGGAQDSGSFGLDAGDDAAVPRWDGTDAWLVDESFVVVGLDSGTPVPVRLQVKQYVSGGVLVVKGLDLPLPLDSVVLPVKEGFLTGNVRHVDGGAGKYSLQNGQITGRVSATSMLAQLQNVFVANKPLCPYHPLYASIKATFCRGVDLASQAASDRAGAPCEALSFATGMTADPAVMGPVVHVPDRLPYCSVPDAAPDDCKH